MERLLIRAAKKAGKFLKDSFYSRDYKEKVLDKGSNDFSIKADYIAEEIYISEFSNKDVKIITEERGEIGNGEIKLVIDPLDGTINFFNGIPIFCTQAALIGNDFKFAVVYNPILNELFFGNNEKSFLNKKEIKVSDLSDISKAIIDFGHRALETEMVKINCFGRRCLCSAGLSIVYVAASIFHASILKDLKVWDYLPPEIILNGANGIVKQVNGFTISSNKILIEKLIEYANKASIS